jgi:hypothetical protein
MTEQNPLNLPPEIKSMINEIIAAHNEKRIKKIRYNNPTLGDIVDDTDPESKKFYIQIIPKETA